jgi:hypothetical protein
MRPAAAASTMAMQKASVRDALMKMSPLTYTWDFLSSAETVSDISNATAVQDMC